jgi:hypothetical protein
VTGFALVPGTVTLRVLSAAEQAMRIAARVGELVAAGTLTGGQGEALTLHLRDNRGDPGKVQAFLNQVGAFLLSGVLPPDDAGDLIGLGELLLTTVTVR